MVNIEEIELEFTADTIQFQQTVQNVTDQMSGLQKVAASLKDSITSAFDISAVTEFIGEAVTASGSLDKQLLVLRLSLGKLKSAIGQAIAPIASVFLSVIQQAIYGVTRLVRSIGLVIGALFGGADSSNAMAQAQEKLSKSSGKAARSLAAFDEIERLNQGSGGSSASVGDVAASLNTTTLTPQLQSVVDTIRSIIAPLQAISFDRAKAAFAALGEAVAQLGKTVGSSLLWAWHNVLTPLAQWTIEEAVPAAVNALSGAFDLLSAVLAPVLAGIQAILPAFQPVAVFLRDTAVQALQLVRSGFEKLTAAFAESGSGITEALSLLGSAFSALTRAVTPVLTTLREQWMALMGGFGSAVATTVQSVLTVLSGLTQFLSGVFTGNWSKAWNGLKTIFKGFVNGVIGLINAMLSGLVGGRQRRRQGPEPLPGEHPGLAARHRRQELRLQLAYPGCAADSLSCQGRGAAGQRPLPGGGGRSEARHQHRSASCHHSGGGGGGAAAGAERKQSAAEPAAGRRCGHPGGR